jgi:hypothetical protein
MIALIITLTYQLPNIVGEARTGDNLSLRAVKISFSLHHSKKADSHSEDKASYTNVNARTALIVNV